MAPMLSCWGLGYSKMHFFFLHHSHSIPSLSWILYLLILQCIYFLFHCFFEPSITVACEIESQLPDLTVQRSIPLTQSDSLSPLSILWGPSNSTPSSAFLSHTAPSNGAALGLKQPPQHSSSQLEERSHCEKMQASSNPAPVMTGRRQLRALRGADWYMQHISRLSQSPQLSPPWEYLEYLTKPVMNCLGYILYFIP